MSSMEITPKKSDIHRKHILAIDYGQKYTGLSNYKVDIDPMILMYGRVKYESDIQMAKELIHIATEEFVDIIILGIPRFTDGKDSKMTKTVQDFGEVLKKHTNLPVYYVDETLTTFEAEERMKNDPRFNFKVDLNQIDALSAVIILEQFVNLATD